MCHSREKNARRHDHEQKEKERKRKFNKSARVVFFLPGRRQLARAQHLAKNASSFFFSFFMRVCRVPAREREIKPFP
jgi:hypothetical protein